MCGYSGDQSEILWLSEVSHFRKQPHNELKPAQIHYYSCNDVASLQN